MSRKLYVNETQRALKWWGALDFTTREKYCFSFLGHKNENQLTNANIKKIWTNNNSWN
jgi:hypothetical protein